MIGIPIAGLILFFRRLFTRRRANPMLKAGLWSFWIVNIISFATIGGFTARQFSSFADLDLTELATPDVDTLYLQADPYPTSTGKIYLFDHNLILDKNEMITQSIQYRIERSPDNKYHVLASASSYGQGPSEATENAAQLNDRVLFTGNTISFPTHLAFTKGTKWRGQKMTYIIQVPDGKHVHINGMIERHLNQIDIDRQQPYPRPYRDQIWVMGENGLYSPAYQKSHQQGSKC